MRPTPTAPVARNVIAAALVALTCLAADRSAAQEMPIAFASSALAYAARLAADLPAGDVTPSQAARVESLHVRATGQYLDLTGLEHFTALRILRIDGGRLHDLTPVGRLPALEDLAIDAETFDADLAPLGQVARLRRLLLSGNGIVDISALARLSRLCRLDLSHNPIVDVSALSGLPVLDSLDITGTRLQSLGPLQFPSLRILHARRAGTPGHVGPIDAPELRELDLWETRATSLGRLDVPQLQELSLSGCGLSVLQGPIHAPDLRTLDLAGNDLDDLGSLAALTTLTHLDIDGSPNADLRPLASLTDLENLSARSAGIASVAPLAGLDRLRRLDLADNRIGDPAPLAALTALETLDLSRNGIDALDFVAALRALTYLGLTDNDVHDLTPLSALGQLPDLMLAGNRIADLAPLLQPGVAGPVYIDVRGNPLSAQAVETQIPDLLARGVGWIDYDALADYPDPDRPLPDARPAIPLQVGNRWDFVVVVRDVRTGEEERGTALHTVAVVDDVAIATLTGDTLLTPAGVANLGGAGATTYGVLATAGVRLFALGGFDDQPDALYVRADADGNVLLRGYSLGDRAYVFRQERAWLRTSGPADWRIALDGLRDPVVTEFHGRAVWVGSGWREFRGSTGGVQSRDPAVVELAHRFLPDLEPASAQRLTEMWGDGGASHSPLSLSMVTGFGPLRISYNVFEYRHSRLDLVSAVVDGRRYVVGGGGTAVRPATWGQVKREVRGRAGLPEAAVRATIPPAMDP